MKTPIRVHLWFHFVQFMQTKILAGLRRIFGGVHGDAWRTLMPL